MRPVDPCVHVRGTVFREVIAKLEAAQVNWGRTGVLDVEGRLDLVIRGTRVADFVLDNKIPRTGAAASRCCARLRGVRAAPRAIGCAYNIIVRRTVRQPGVRVARRRDTDRHVRVRTAARRRPFHRVTGGTRRSRPA
ncbi:hypothetical protein D3C77_557270 [compost metagenome]